MKLLVARTAYKQLLKIPFKIRSRIESRIEKLANSPFSKKSKKLSNRPGYRIRIGDYRIIYFIDKKKKTITVLSASHRKNAYRKL